MISFHTNSRARFCVHSGGGKSMWCPDSKSHQPAARNILEAIDNQESSPPRLCRVHILWVLGNELPDPLLIAKNKGIEYSPLPCSWQLYRPNRAFSAPTRNNRDPRSQSKSRAPSTRTIVTITNPWSILFSSDYHCVLFCWINLIFNSYDRSQLLFFLRSFDPWTRPTSYIENLVLF